MKSLSAMGKGSMSERKILKMSLIEFLVKSEYGRPRYVYSAIFIIGIVLIWLGTHSSPCFIADPYSLVCLIASDKFIKEIGVAFVIGALVGSTVEIYNLRRHELDRQELKEDASKNAREVAFYAVRQGVLALFPALSEKILVATHRHILEATVTRENFAIQIDFNEIKGGSNLRVQTSIRYKLRNPSSISLTHDFVFLFEPEMKGDRKRNTELKYLKLASEALNGAEDIEKSGLVDRNEDRVVGLRKALTLPSNSVTDVFLQYSEERCFADIDYWIMTIPSDGISLTIASCEGLDYYVDALHPDDPDQEPSATDARIKTWELRQGLLPGQGLLLRWIFDGNCGSVGSPPHRAGLS